MNIECLNCSKEIEIPKWIDTKDYDGEMKCPNCKSRLYIKFKGSEKPVKYKLLENLPFDHDTMLQGAREKLEKLLHKDGS